MNSPSNKFFALAVLTFVILPMVSGRFITFDPRDFKVFKQQRDAFMKEVPAEPLPHHFRHKLNKIKNTAVEMFQQVFCNRVRFNRMMLG